MRTASMRTSGALSRMLSSHCMLARASAAHSRSVLLVPRPCLQKAYASHEFDRTQLYGAGQYKRSSNESGGAASYADAGHNSRGGSDGFDEGDRPSKRRRSQSGKSSDHAALRNEVLITDASRIMRWEKAGDFIDRSRAFKCLLSCPCIDCLID